jgi:sugar/nucleoside kinase (ribokinase family)
VLVYYEPNEPVDRNFLRAVAASDIVKFSNEKHPDVSFTEGFTNKLFIQTMSEKGLRFKLRAEGWITIPPEHNPHAVDGEGAGDWTTSAFIHEMGHHRMLTFDRIHLPNVTHCLEEAQRVASQSVSYIGAKGLIHH